MGQASRAGGLYYINGKPVDANGNAVAGAPAFVPVVHDAQAKTKSTAQEIGEGVALALVDLGVIGDKPKTPTLTVEDGGEKGDDSLPPAA